MAKKKRVVRSAKTVDTWSEPKSVTIKAASNGYVVTTYTSTGESIGVAKDYDEAQKMAKRILKG